MTIDFSEIINKLELIQEYFNESKDPVERFAMIQAVNHIAKNELPFDENDWVFKQHYNDSMRAIFESKG